MAGFLKNLKGLFIASDEELIEAERKRTGQPSPTSSSTSVSETSQSESASNEIILDKSELTSSAEGQVDQKFMDILLDSLTKNNQEGYDYLEYKQALQSLKKMDMDEGTRFQSAFAMAQTMGATKDKLVATGDIYLGILKKEEENFMKSVANQRQSKIEERKKELLNIDKWIAEKEEEIKKITQQIERKKADKAKYQSNLSATAKKIETVKNNFEASYQFLSSQIVDDLNKIKKHIK